MGTIAALLQRQSDTEKPVDRGQREASEASEASDGGSSLQESVLAMQEEMNRIRLLLDGARHHSIKPSPTSVSGLKLLVYQVLSY